ncbi:MAG: prepilin peptidase [Planctomycetota bacterium]
MGEIPWFGDILFGLLGLIIGSFLNVVIHRLPIDGASLVRPRSSCPKCGHEIRWFENLPVLSYLFLRGKCRGCQAPISLRYPMVELITGGLFVALYETWMVPYLADGPSTAEWLRLFVWFYLVSVLIAATFIDIDHRILPDELTLSGLILAPLACVLCPLLQEDRIGAVLVTKQGWQHWLPLLAGGIAAGATMVVLRVHAAAELLDDESDQSGQAMPPVPKRSLGSVWPGVLVGVVVGILTFLLPQERSAALVSSAIGIGIGGGLLLAVGLLGTFAFKKEAMGFGDVKYLAMIGGFLGARAALLTFLLACVLGSVLGLLRMLFTKDHYLAFGPYLSVGAILVLLFEDRILVFVTETWPNLFR